MVPDSMRIGDTIGIADPEGELYLNARIIKIETSSERDNCTITLGNYSTAKSGISDKVAKLTKAQRAAANTPKYQWVIYADSPSGDGMRLDPEEAQWMGVASNKASPEPNLTDPYLYEWTRIVGDDGEEGIQGEKGDTGEKGEDAVTLRIDSTRGLVFKNSWYDTQLRVTIIKGAKTITGLQELQAEFGAGACLQWSWRRQAGQDWQTMSVSDSHIAENGFALNVTPQDVDEQITFQCDLVV